MSTASLGIHGMMRSAGTRDLPAFGEGRGCLVGKARSGMGIYRLPPGHQTLGLLAAPKKIEQNVRNARNGGHGGATSCLN